MSIKKFRSEVRALFENAELDDEVLDSPDMPDVDGGMYPEEPVAGEIPGDEGMEGPVEGAGEVITMDKDLFVALLKKVSGEEVQEVEDEVQDVDDVADDMEGAVDDVQDEIEDETNDLDELSEEEVEGGFEDEVQDVDDVADDMEGAVDDVSDSFEDEETEVADEFEVIADKAVELMISSEDGVLHMDVLDELVPSEDEEGIEGLDGEVGEFDTDVEDEASLVDDFGTEDEEEEVEEEL